jgi:hypothetical protein
MKYRHFHVYSFTMKVALFTAVVCALMMAIHISNIIMLINVACGDASRLFERFVNCTVQTALYLLPPATRVHL